MTTRKAYRLSAVAPAWLVAVGALLLGSSPLGCHSADLRNDSIFTSSTGAIGRAKLVAVIEVDGWNADLRRWTLTGDQAERARRLFSSRTTYAANDPFIDVKLAMVPTFRLEFDEASVLVDSCAMIAFFTRGERLKRLASDCGAAPSVANLLADVAGAEAGCLGGTLSADKNSLSAKP